MLPWDHGGRRSGFAWEILAILKTLEIDGSNYKIYQDADFGEYSDTVSFICSYPESRRDYDFQVTYSGGYPYRQFSISLCQPRCYFNGSWVNEDGTDGTNISEPLPQIIESLWGQLSELDQQRALRQSNYSGNPSRI